MGPVEAGLRRGDHKRGKQTDEVFNTVLERGKTTEKNGVNKQTIGLDGGNEPNGFRLGKGREPAAMGTIREMFCETETNSITHNIYQNNNSNRPSTNCKHAF